MDCLLEITIMLFIVVLGFLITRVKKFADRVNKPYPEYMPVNSYYVDISEDGILGGFLGAVVAALAHFLSAIVLLAFPSSSASFSSGDMILLFFTSIPFVCGPGIIVAVVGGVLGGIATDFLIRRGFVKPNRAYVALGGGIVSSLGTLLIIVL